jgi:tetratricopeptide (TPR) repeat protein
VAPDAVRRIHGLIVRALVQRRSEDFEALFEHYQGAGETENAAIQASHAAEKADAALAFDRAASFYRHALRLTPASPAAHAWQTGLADALANAGRPAEAAEAYIAAAAAAGRTDRVEFLRRAAEQFLIGGHIDRGLDLIRTVLAERHALGPRSRSALWWLLWRRARLHWRGLHFVPRPVDAIDADLLLRIDTCWSATAGLALVDVIHALDFSMRHLLMAPRRRTLPSRARNGDRVSGQSRVSQRQNVQPDLLQQSKDLAARVGQPDAIAMSILADGMSATAVGEWKRG